MGFWSIVVPAGTTNLVHDPSFEGSAWAVNAGAPTIVGGEGKFGVYASQVAQNNNYVDETSAASITPAASYALSYYAKAAVAGQTPTARVRFIWRTNVPAAISTETLDIVCSDGYQRATVVATAPALSDNVQMIVETSGAQFANIDAIQIEATQVTTYCDGTQSGCEWNGTAHASTSTRSALSRAGGRVYDLSDDFGFYVTRHIDSGVAPLTQHLDEYANIPGGEISTYKVHPRVLTLVGYMRSLTSYATLHAQIQAFFDVIKPDAVPGNQPVLLRYTEATVTKEISVVYEGGLGGNWDARMCAEQRFPVRFLAADPWWYEIGESAAVLDTNDTATLRYIAGRLRSTGQWDDLGLAAPAGASEIYCILIASDNQIYIGGNFDDWDGVANRNNVARYDPSTDTWYTWGAVGDFNDYVLTLIEGPDGRIYAGGAFTNCHAVAAADYLAVWDGTAWAAVGIPLAGAAAITDVQALAFDSLGNLYVGGNFTNWADVAAADYFAAWDGTTWTAVGAGGTGSVLAIALDENDNIYIGGAFINWAADADADYLAWWNGTAWAAVNDTALSTNVNRLLYDNDHGLLYIGGYFTNAAGIAEADYLVTWNGQTFAAVGGGITSTLANPGVTGLSLAPDGSLYVTGYRLEMAEDVTLVDSLARWNGSAWSHIDVDLPGTPYVYAIDTGRTDPTSEDIYEVYLGFTVSGAGYFSGGATVTNDGTTSVFPTIVVERSGGTSATLVQVRNETTGKELLFDYALLDGERLTVDLAADTVVSSFFGKRFRALLTTADSGLFALRGGTNNITAFVSAVGAPTVTAYMVWRNKYWSID